MSNQKGQEQEEKKTKHEQAKEHRPDEQTGEQQVDAVEKDQQEEQKQGETKQHSHPYPHSAPQTETVPSLSPSLLSLPVPSQSLLSAQHPDHSHSLLGPVENTLLHCNISKTIHNKIHFGCSNMAEHHPGNWHPTDINEVNAGCATNPHSPSSTALAAPTSSPSGVGTGTGTIASAGVDTGGCTASPGIDVMEEKKEPSPSAPLPGSSKLEGAMPTVHPSPAMPGEIVKTDDTAPWANDLPTKKFSEAEQTIMKDLIHTHKHFAVRQSPAMNEWLGICSCLSSGAASDLERLQIKGGDRKLDDAMRGAIINLLRQTAYNCDAVQGGRPDDTIVITSTGFRVPDRDEYGGRMKQQQPGLREAAGSVGKVAYPSCERKEGKGADSRAESGSAKEKKPSTIKKIKQIFMQPS